MNKKLPSSLLCYILVTASCLAESYSINVQSGLSVIANQLDHGTNRPSDIMSGVPDGSVLYKYDNTNGNWETASYSAATGTWTPDSMRLNPGEGAFFQSPTNFTLTITGTPITPVLPVTIPNGACYLLSNQTNDIGTYESIVGNSPVDGATVYQWDGSNYNSSIYSAGGWVDAASNSVPEPTAVVGEALWISPTGTPPPAGPQSYSIVLQSGENLIANQLDHGSNTLDEVIPDAPDGAVIVKWDCASQYYTAGDTFVAGSGWFVPDFSAPSTTTLALGEAAFIQNPGPSGSSLTFSGIPHVPVLPPTLACGFGTRYLLARQTNDIGNYENVTGFAPEEGSEVQTWDGVEFVTNLFTGGSWSLGTPSLSVGQGAMFFIPVGSTPPPLNYSINIQPGYNLIANQLDHGSNTLDEIIPGVPDGSFLYKYNNIGSNWAVSAYCAALGTWVPDTVTLSPGEGAFFQSPTNFTLTFTGTPHVPVLPVIIPAGTPYLLSRQTNDIGDYANIVGIVPPNHAKIYQWIGGTFNVSQYNSVSGTWSSGGVDGPTAAVGEALWIAPSGGAPAPLPTTQFVMFGGLMLQSRGAATLTVESNTLVVDNFGTNGQDGVSIYLAGNGSLNLHWLDFGLSNSIADGSYLEKQVIGLSNGIPGQVLQWTRHTQNGSQIDYTAGFPLTQPTNFNVMFLGANSVLGTRLVSASSGAALLCSTMQIPTSGGGSGWQTDSEDQMTHVYCYALVGPDIVTGETTYWSDFGPCPCSLTGDNGIGLDDCDREETVTTYQRPISVLSGPSNGIVAVRVDTGALPVGSPVVVSLVGSGLPKLTLTDLSVSPFGLPVYASGTAVLSAGDSYLNVIAANPIVGAGISVLEPVGAAPRVQLQPVTFGAVTVQFQVAAEGNTTGQSNIVLGKITMTNNQVFSDFSALGASATLVEVFSNSLAVGADYIAGSSIGGFMSQPTNWPSITEVGALPAQSFGFTIKSGMPLTFVTANSNSLTGTSFAFEAVNNTDVVQSIRKLDLNFVGLNSIQITGTSTLPEIPTAFISREGSSILVGTTAPGGVLESATSIAGPWASVPDAVNLTEVVPTNSSTFYKVVFPKP